MFSNRNDSRKPFRRVLALVLTIALLTSVIVTQFDSISGFVQGIAESDPLNRIYSILQGEVGEPETYDDYYQLATIAIGQGDYEGALKHLDKCLELADREDAVVMGDLWLKIGSLYALQGDYESALPSLDLAIEADAESSQAYLLRAQIRLENAEYEMAIEDIARYLELVPADNTLRTTLAQIYETLGQYDNARMIYEELFVLLPEEEGYHLDSLRCLFQAGDLEGALAGYEKYLGIGEEETLVGNEEGASESEAEPDPLRATAEFMRASCLLNLTRYPEACEGYERAERAGYNAAMCREQLVTAYFAAEEYEKAIETGAALLQSEEEPMAKDVLLQRMGASAMSLERNEEAVEYLTQSIEANPELVGTYYYRGVTLLSLSRHEEAIEDFTQSIEQGYLEQFCYYNRGVCYVQLGDYENALNDMELTLTKGDEQTLKDAATDILWQLASYYENQALQQAGEPIAEAEQITQEQIQDGE